MDMRKAYPSTYLAQEDLEGHPNQERVCVIRGARMEDVDRDPTKPNKPVVYIEGESRGIVLNKTNNAMLINAFGDTSEQWAGKSFVLWWNPEVMFGADKTGGLRMKLQPSAPSVPAGSMIQPQEPGPITEGEEPQDDMPF